MQQRYRLGDLGALLTICGSNFPCSGKEIRATTSSMRSSPSHDILQHVVVTLLLRQIGHRLETSYLSQYQSYNHSFLKCGIRVW